MGALKKKRNWLKKSPAVLALVPPSIAQAAAVVGALANTRAVQRNTLMRGDPALVAEAIDISKLTHAKIRQNLFWAFVYNVVGIPLAALGCLNPVLGGAAMAFSGVSVVSNALLLRRWKRHQLTERLAD